MLGQNQSDVALGDIAESQTDVQSPESVGFKATKVVLYFLILTVSLFGNSLLVYIICFTKSLRLRASSLLILNLALCDAFTPLLSIPFDFALEENAYVWPFGAFLCRAIWPAATLTATCSSLTLAAISMDRYRRLMHPYKPRLTFQHIKLIIICIFIVSLAVVSPYVSVLHIEGSTCTEKWPNDSLRKAYTIILFLVQYALPLLFMAIVYSLALGNLHAIAGKTWRMRSIERDASEKKSVVENHKEVLQNRRRRFSRRTSSGGRFHVEQTNVQATKMFIAIVVIFAIFMLPNQIIWLWADLGGGDDHPELDQAKIICWLFTYTNSVLNPIIFTFFNRDFKHGVFRLIKKLFCKKRHTGRHRSSGSQPNDTNSTRCSVSEPGRRADFYQVTSSC